MLAARPGFALETTLMFLFALVVIGGAVYTMSKPQMRASVYQAKRTQSFYMAEAGLQDALQVLASSHSWIAGFTAKPFMSGFYTVKLDTTTTPVTLTSKGWVGAGAPGRTVGSAVKVNLNLNSPLLSYTIGASTGGVILNNGSIVNGNVYTGGGINVPGGCSINGVIESVAPPPLFIPVTKPSAPCNYTSTMTTLGPCYVDGDLYIVSGASVKLTGTLWVSGYLKIDNGSSMTGMYTVYLGGAFLLGNHSRLGDNSATNSPFIFADGPAGLVKIDNAGDASNVVVYAPGREVLLNNGSTLTGSVIGLSVTLWNHITITHADIAMPGPGYGVIPKSWAELY